MDYARARDSHRSQTAATDLGDELPLFVDGGSHSDFDRSRVSVRWLSGTILTGLCGAALMGGAVFAAVGDHFADKAERVESMRSAAVRSSVRKSDRMPPLSEGSAARQVFHMTTIAKVGDREVPRVKPLTRISSNLALTTSDLTANMPRFNPQGLADSDTVAAAELPDTAAAPDPEVSFVIHDLASSLPRVHVVATPQMDEVVRKVREVASLPAEDNGEPAAYRLAALPGMTFMTEENITVLPKTAQQATGGNPGSERIVAIKKGDLLQPLLLQNANATPEEARAIYQVLERGRDGSLREGQKLRILVVPAQDTLRPHPVRVMLLNDQNTVEAVVALSDSNRYVNVDVQMAEAPAPEAQDDDDDSPTGVRLYQSIYETGLRNHVPRPVIDELVKIYSYDVDFQRKARPGDAFEVVYSGDEQNADPKPDVVYASVTVGGEAKKYYRFVSPDDSVVDYYDQSGKSAKKFLVRKPVNEAVMRSGFGLRKHPILGDTRMHTGVDWACPYGTPIHAAGNGEIEKAGWESGYGKYIKIRHANGYETAYGHMTAFARGIEPGTKVHQGQVIGFVGSTGQSTGPHVHYEIYINGHVVDPMRIKLPRGRELAGPILEQFEHERDKVESLMSQPTRTAQTTLVSR